MAQIVFEDIYLNILRCDGPFWAQELRDRVVNRTALEEFRLRYEENFSTKRRKPVVPPRQRQKIKQPVALSSSLLIFVGLCHLVSGTPRSSSSSPSSFRLVSSQRQPGWWGKRYDINDDDWLPSEPKGGNGADNSLNNSRLQVISGREFDLYDSSSCSRTVKQDQHDDSIVRKDGTTGTPYTMDHQIVKNVNAGNGRNPEGGSEFYDSLYGSSRSIKGGDDGAHHVRASSVGRKFSEYGGRASSLSTSSSQAKKSSPSSSSSSGFFLVPPPVAEWWTYNVVPSLKSWPKLNCRIQPTTTLKIRKTFRPLKTIVQFGADFNTQVGVWQFKSSWEDAIIGGKLTLAGRELQLTKSWQLSVGAMEDLVTRLRVRAAVDLQTWKASVRAGFRTERLTPINVMEGFTLLKQVPLDGQDGHIKLEVKANVALPEPEIEYSTETQRSLIGMGDIEVSIDELNLVLDY
jgi:hypothetical protein